MYEVQNLFNIRLLQVLKMKSIKQDHYHPIRELKFCRSCSPFPFFKNIVQNEINQNLFDNGKFNFQIARNIQKVALCNHMA